MKRRDKWFVVLALAGACSSPDRNAAGFISLGRNVRNGDLDGGLPATGGAFVTGGTFGDAGAGGTIVVQGGTTGVTGGTPGDTNGGTTGVNGGTSAGGEGPSCGSGGMPLVPEPNSGGSALFEACGEAGPNQRICLMDGTVFHCGMIQIPVEQCDPGTCETGCCHASYDPCPLADPLAIPSIDCAGDCDGIESCVQPTTLNLTIAERVARIVRVGQNTQAERCGDGTRRYFELFLTGSAALLMVSPPWMLAEPFTCADAPHSQCLVSQAGARVVAVMTDADSPPPRNIVIYADERVDLTCESQY